VHTGRFGPDLRFRTRYEEDGSLIELFFLQYQDPALAPILEACLGPGDVFFDVGANIGVYSAWAARLVGAGGEVHGFEPIPATRARFESLIAMNRLENVRVVPTAIGEEPGETVLWVMPGASGNTSGLRRSEDSEPLTVKLDTLDGYVAATGCRTPALLKIDVEGFELSVLRGARELMRGSAAPAVVFECWPRQGAHDPLAEIARWFAQETDRALYALLPSGLRPIGPDAGGARSLNTLALHAERHAAVAQRLRRVRFRRNQNC
jgi:FkbM family methyltransferase